VIGGLPFEEKPVYDASPEAIAYGVKAGMPLHEAYALCPTAKFLSTKHEQYKQIFEEVADVLERFSPVVDIEKPGCAYFDISGVQDEMNLCQNVLRDLSADTGLSACLGVSSGRFFSRIAAFTSKPEMPVIVSPGQEKYFVAPFSIDLLQSSNESKKRLHFLGIRFIGDLTHFPREALVAQFGSDGSLMHDLAHGIDRSPLVPRAKPEVAAHSIRLSSPAVSLIEILRACEIILVRLFSGVKRQGKVCREVTLTLVFTSGMWEKRKLALKEPTSSSRLIVSRLQTWLESIRLPSPVIEVGLSLSLTREQGKKLSLWPDNGRSQEGLIKAARELKLRFGHQPIKKARRVRPKPILPEREFILTDVLE
jgi:nucleotidyltransferase/DNA polymerase involved in DNA repair